jgi:chlorobactene glucosyltransferase
VIEKRENPVSVIIPARNEETNIARSVRSVAAQQGVVEIIAVDDQSQDRTADVVSALSREIPPLRIVHVDSLPAGWTGKSHALALGAAEAKGEWLLFTDADTEHLPGSLQQLLERAEAARADLLSVSPGQRTVTWWEKAVLPQIFLQLARLYDFDEVSDPNSPQAAANGQYILVRRSAYERVGGHQAARQAILEDVDLARRVKQSGGRLLFLPGGAWVQTRMYTRFGDMWAGWSKNLYLLFGQSLNVLLMTAMRIALLNVVLPLILVALPFLLGGTHSILSFSVCWVSASAVLARQHFAYRNDLYRLGFDPSLARYMVLGSALFTSLLLDSARIYRTGGKVHWKGRTYPAKESV